MKWVIPSKTFLVGEYVALDGGPSIILTTSPCFEMLLSAETDAVKGINSSSPAGVWWQQQNIQNFGLEWFDPYHGMGGLGASSAQFLGAFYASSFVKNQKTTIDTTIEAYLKSAWNGAGVAPSGYDVIAQSMRDCVYLHRKKAIYQTYAWPFSDLSFVLIHTGKKLPTHHHLQVIGRLDGVDSLARIVELARSAFVDKNSDDLISSVNAYHEQLLKMDLVAEHSIEMIERLKAEDDILAIKGCGALGADILLAITPSSSLDEKIVQLKSDGWSVIATSDNLV
jgi:mevalonate kinase